MTDSNKLNSIIKGSGYKLEFLASQIGKTRAGLYNKINGSSEFTSSEMYKLCDILNIAESEARDIFFNQ